MVRNLGLLFSAVPEGYPKPGKDITVKDRPISLDDTTLEDGGLLVKTHYASFDPYQRGRMRAPEIKSYSPPYTLGEPIVNSAISSVVKSSNDKFKEGDVVIVYMSCPTEEYSVLKKELVDRTVKKLENPHGLDLKLFLGPLGMPGLTAYSRYATPLQIFPRVASRSHV